MKKLFISITFCLTIFAIQAHPGIGLVYDGNKTIYYSDLTHVWKLNMNSGKTEIYVENVHTHELFLDKDGNLYGEHYWYIESEQKFKNYIWRVNSNGEFEKIRGDQYGENYDFGFVRDKSFASYEIQEQNGIYEILKKDSLSQMVLHKLKLKHPTWKYLTREGELLFVDFPTIYSTDKGNIKTVSNNISSSRFPFSTQNDNHSIYGIWTDQIGNIYVAIYAGREVKRIDTNGITSTVLKTSFLWSPVNGVIDNENNLWLMECKVGGKIRIRKINQSELTSKASFFIENSLITGLLLLVIIATFIGIKRKHNKKLRPTKYM